MLNILRQHWQLFYKFYLKGNLLDFVILAGDKKLLRCHKAVLAAYSDLFCDLMMTTGADQIILADCPIHEVRHLLEFMYAGR